MKLTIELESIRFDSDDTASAVIKLNNSAGGYGIALDPSVAHEALKFLDDGVTEAVVTVFESG